jgi:hypothetical protein
MARRASPDPATLWFDFALRSWEMFSASGQVIAARTARMARAGTSPGARDRREFSRMGSEKAQAATQSAFAMAMSLQQAWWQAWLQMLAAGLAPVHRTATANARRLTRRR